MSKTSDDDKHIPQYILAAEIDRLNKALQIAKEGLLKIVHVATHQSYELDVATTALVKIQELVE